MNNAIEQALIAHILQKPELSHLDSSFVRSHLQAYFRENPQILAKLREADGKHLEKNAQFKEVSKYLRTHLREIYGAFWLPGWRKRDALLGEVLKEPSLANHQALLITHRSTNERLPTYPLLYKTIFSHIPKAKHILDLGGGYNVFSYPYLGFSPSYSVCEVSSEDCVFLQKYLKGRGIIGKCISGDLTLDPPDARADVVFLFKLLDTLEQQKKGSSIKLLNHCLTGASWLVVSFATKSLSGKPTLPMHIRQWFLRWIEHKEYSDIIFPNETFYLVKGDK